MKVIAASLAILFGLVAPLTAHAADASSIIERFKTLCVATEGNLPAAIAVADKLGWNAAQSNDKDSGDMKLLRGTQEDSGAWLLMGGKGNFGDQSGTFVADACSVAFIPKAKTPIRVESGVDAWLGFAPTRQEADQFVYVYADHGGVRTGFALTDGQKIESAFMDRSLREVVVTYDGELTALTYSTPALKNQ
jgi:hypothetical protein